MASPFPGMDPYLEDPVYWPDIHHNLATYIRDELSPQIAPAYYAHVGERVYIARPADVIIPDVSIILNRQSVRVPAAAGRGGTAVLEREADSAEVIALSEMEIREPFVQIRDARRGGRVVTVIEILSPTNKAPNSEGARQYRHKQEEVLGSGSSLVEIDLLRAGFPMFAFPSEAIPPPRNWDYMIAVNRAHARSEFEIYRRTVRERLPRIAVPLSEEDPDAVLNLQELLDRCYRNGAYEHLLNYSADPPYPLRPEDRDWAARLAAAWKAEGS